MYIYILTERESITSGERERESHFWTGCFSLVIFFLEGIGHGRRTRKLDEEDDPPPAPPKLPLLATYRTRMPIIATPVPHTQPKRGHAVTTLILRCILTDQESLIRQVAEDGDRHPNGVGEHWHSCIVAIVTPRKEFVSSIEFVCSSLSLLFS